MNKYSWLETIGTLPKIVQTGLSLLGTQEVVGRGSNKTIISWRDILNQKGARITGYSDDDIPWCGLFVAWLSYSRIENIDEVVINPLWARNWLNYGVAVKSPMLGDILVFERGSGGHVGVYIAEDDDCYHVLGGNQSNKVSIARIEKTRLLGARRPKYQHQPTNVKKFFVSTGGTISQNEA